MEVRYLCEKCGHKFTKHVMDKDEEVVCPMCGKRQRYTRMVMEPGEAGKLVPEKKFRWW